MTKELVGLYRKIFMKKQAEADSRVEFIWTDLADFKDDWKKKSQSLGQEIVIVDEGDLILEREIFHLPLAVWPRRLVLLSALPREAWTAT